MIGMLGSVLGAGASIAGALIGADAQREATQTNWAIALMNYYARERERWEAKIEGRRIEAKQDQGITDAQGNRTHYVPGKGYVVDLSPESEALQNRIYAEQMAQLGPDAQKRRQQLQRNEVRQIQEDDRAKALFDAMRKVPLKNPDVIENLLYNAATTNVNRAFDDTTAMATRQAMRTKSTNAGKMLDDIAKKRSDALTDAGNTSRAQALQVAPKMNEEDQKVRANLYNMFATRASQMPDVSKTVPQLKTDDNLALAAKLGQGANDLTSKAVLSEGGRLPFIPPNYGMANAAGAIGASLQGLMRNLGSSGMSMGNDLYDEMERRYRGDQGTF